MNPRYEIQGQLGEGGEASVWKAWDTKLQRFVAIKRLLPPSQREVPEAGDIMAEAAALSALQHPNIVGVYDVELDDAVGPYVVMEFLNGENLEQTVQRGALTREDFQSITLQALEGLVAAHKMGMRHRDIKPGNIMLTWLPDQRFIAKLLDFGLAKFTSRPLQQTVKGNNKILGSIYFMAPEQFAHRPLDHRSDLYSLGCVLYYGLTTRYPFAGDTPSQVIQSHLDHLVAPLRDIRPDVPSLQCDWVMWLLRRQPEHRPRDAVQALETFRGIVNGTLKELPQVVTGLRTTTVMPTRKVATPPSASAPASAKSVAQTKKRWLWPTIGSVGAAAVATFLLLNSNDGSDSGPRTSSKQKNETADNKSAPLKPVAPTNPVSQGLVIWLDAAKGVFGKDGKTPPKSGDEFYYWRDQAATLGGATDFQAPSEKAPDGNNQAPRFRIAKSTHGLVGEHPVVAFSGHDSLLYEVQSGSVANGLLDSTVFNLYAVMWLESGGAGVPITRIVAAKCGSEVKAWDLEFDQNDLRIGVRKADGKPNVAGVPYEPRKDEYVIVNLVRDGPLDKGFIEMRRPDGKVFRSPTIKVAQNHGPLTKIRLGATAEFTKQSEADFFKGELAEVLLFNRVLSEAEQLAVMNYLSQRYFGK